MTELTPKTSSRIPRPFPVRSGNEKLGKQLISRSLWFLFNWGGVEEGRGKRRDLPCQLVGRERQLGNHRQTGQTAAQPASHSASGSPRRNT